MADIKSAEARSKNMSAIKNKDTKPEVYFRKLLFAKGYRYRKNVKMIVGHPDLYMGKYKTAVFINGCFWHRHEGCKYTTNPKSRVEFWEKKFSRNIERDKEVQEELKKQKIKCLVVWECTIKQMMRSEEFAKKVLEDVEKFLISDECYEQLYK